MSVAGLTFTALLDVSEHIRIHTTSDMAEGSNFFGFRGRINCVNLRETTARES